MPRGDPRPGREMVGAGLTGVPPTLEALRLVAAKDFKAEGTGRYYLAGNGKRKEETVGVEYFHTAGAGCLRADVWYQKAEEAVERENKGVLLTALISYCEEHCAWLTTYTALRQYSLEILADRIYEKWKDFHNPEVVELEDYF